MECIEIKVNKDTAEKWRNTSPKQREQIERRMEIELMNELLQPKKDRLIQSMDRLAKTAQANGLTEKILQEILSEDD